MVEKDLMNFIKILDEAIKGSIFYNKVYIVGGAVRDYILKREIKDIDIAVLAPNGGIALCEYLKYKLKVKSSPVIYPNYGTAKLDIEIPEYGIVPIEFVQTRKEWYTNGSRKPSAIALGSIKEDAERRDLTINALYLNVNSKKIEDPTGKGNEDMLNKVRRVTSNPDEVFEDDPLRMLRVIRFKSQLGYGIDKDTFVGIINSAPQIKNISQERITEELSKILLSKKPSVGLDMLRNTMLMKHILFPLYSMKDNINDDGVYDNLYEHTLDVVDNTKPILANRLAALFHDYGKIFTLSTNVWGKPSFSNHEIRGAELAKKRLTDLKFPNKLIDDVCFAIENHSILKIFNGDLKNMGDRTIRRIVRNTGDRLDLVMDVIKADNFSKSDIRMHEQVDVFYERMNALQQKGENLKEIKLPVNGNDIMNFFKIKGGPVIAKFLKLAALAYYGNPEITKDETLEFLNKKKHLILKTK